MKRVWLIAAVLLLIAAASAFVYFRMQPQPSPEQLVYGSGRIETYEVRVAPEVPGRLVENRVREGQTVGQGELIARIDPADFDLQTRQAEAERKASRFAAKQFDAQIHLAKHHAATARTELARYETLRRQGWVTIPQLDLRRNTYQEAVDRLSVLRQQRAQADARTEVASRTLGLARQRLGRTVIRSPLSGAVLERLAEPGEVIALGQPIAILSDMQKVRLKIFISEKDLGKIRLGSAARIRVDAFPSRDFPAKVAQVDAQAQFTPRDVHMADERARTVYGITLEAENPQGLLKPGMPADAWILWLEKAGWPDRLMVPE